MSASRRAPLKRTRAAQYLRRRAQLAEREQRSFDRRARQFVSWERSK